jgi:hypothetical protein
MQQYNIHTEKKRIGFLKGHIMIPDDFDKIGQNEITESFEAI